MLVPIYITSSSGSNEKSHQQLIVFLCHIRKWGKLFQDFTTKHIK
jgi:hypothetical protein